MKAEIYCRNCGKKYNSDIKNCPNCNYPTENGIKSNLINDLEETKEVRNYGTGILGQLFFGTLLALFIMWTISLPKNGTIAMLITVVISYNPFFYVNSKNAKWQRIAVWTVFLLLIAWPILGKMYS